MFTPSQKSLKAYADVLIKFALNSGKGIKKNDVVFLVTQTPGLPLAHQIYSTILKMGGHAIVNVIDDHFKLLQIRNASDKQLLFFPEKYYRGLADTIDHWVRILADDDPMFLKNEDPQRIILSQRAGKPFRDWLDKKEDNGKFTWTLCLYPTAKAAQEAGISEKEYWQQIERSCFLDQTKPVEIWRSVFDHMQKILKTINALPIKQLHIAAPETDLWIELGEKRRWMGGSGRNIPSFEIFTSPDWRGTNGHIFFDLPLYRFGNIIKDIHLEFKNGKIIKAQAAKNESLLKAMIAQKNADKIGEFSLTDKRFSRISKFMANTLFDENFGGKYGNTHLAVGKSYHDACSGNVKKMTAADFNKLGFNDSVEHTDIIATSNRVVEAVMKDGSIKVIYRDGEFRI